MQRKCVQHELVSGRMTLLLATTRTKPLDSREQTFNAMLEFRVRKAAR